MTVLITLSLSIDLNVADDGSIISDKLHKNILAAKHSDTSIVLSVPFQIQVAM